MNTDAHINQQTGTHKLLLATFGGGLALQLASLIFAKELDVFRVENIPLHASIEMSGSVIAFIIAYFLLRIKSFGEGPHFNVLIAGGLIGMGFLDGLHALMPPGKMFVWLRISATVWGGFLFALICLPFKWTNSLQKYWPRVVLCGAVIWSSYTFLSPDSVPQMVVDGALTSTAHLLNFGGGILFLIASNKLFFSYRRTHNVADLLFCLQCVLFGVAAIMFWHSNLWDASWWTSHIMRLSAYAFALWIIFIKTDQVERNGVAMELRNRENRIRALFDTVVDGVVIINAKGLIQDLNPAAIQLFGYSPDEAKNNNISLFMPEPYAKEHDSYMHNYLTTGVKKVIGLGREVTGKRKDGSTFPMKLAVSEMNVNGDRMFTGIVRDITVRKAIEKAQAQLSAIVAHSTDAIMSKTLKGIVTSWNKAAENLFGYSAEEMIGKPMALLIPSDRADEEPQILAKIRRGESIENFETVRQKKNGEMVPISVTISPIKDNNGNIVGVSKIARDITEQKKIERMKAEFISTVSHESRTPLTSIRGALGLVLGKASEGLSDKAKQLLETASRNSERLTVLINDILDLEKIESGRLAFEFKDLDLANVIQQAVTGNEGYAVRHQVTLKIAQCPPKAPIFGDEARLLQVLANLFSNAVKYSNPNGVVEASVVEQGDSHFRVSVKDHGRGIPEEFRERMFQRFSQADSSDAREKGGTGLGLSITKAIVERHGGNLDYISQLGVGTEFFFDITRGKEAKNKRSAQKEGPSNTLLICEDNPDVAMVLANLVEAEGFTADIATTGMAALSMIGKRNYQVLLLDLGLPDMNGLTLIHELKSKEATKHLPVIVVSGQVDEGKKAWGGDALAVLDWLQKPVDVKRLSAALAKALAQSESRPSILHVEDDMDVVQVVQVLVEEMGDYIHAPTLVGARELLANNRFDLVILDIGLPDGSGLALLNELVGTPVVVFSGQEWESLPEQKVSVSAILTKSKVSNMQLITMIRQALKS